MITEDRFEVAPYFDDLLRRLNAEDPVVGAAYGRHVHWGYWADPKDATGSPQDYGEAAERLCRMVCDAAGITDGMRILDVGCGFGGALASLNERFTDLDMVGVNLDARQLERAAAIVRPTQGNRIQFVQGDACCLNRSLGSFDVVLAVECIFHFASRAAFFDGASSLLRPGGSLALSDLVPPRDALTTLAQQNAGADEATRITFGRVDINCPLEEYHALAQHAGLIPFVCSDITAGTMPTYPFLQDDLRARPDRKAARIHSRAVSRLEIACRLGLLKYLILSFTRRTACE